jgi:hypothetical protein
MAAPFQIQYSRCLLLEANTQDGILSDIGLKIIIKVLSASFIPDCPIAQTQNLGIVIHTLGV